MSSVLLTRNTRKNTVVRVVTNRSDLMFLSYPKRLTIPESDRILDYLSTSYAIKS